MTRTVFDTAQVAHVWAQGRQESGRNSARRVFFEGAKLFSYGTHFLTGYRLPDGAAFLNSARYSVSTSRHCQDARHAIPGRLSDVTGQAMRLYIPGPLMGTGGGRRGYSSGFPLPDFFDSRVFRLPQYVTREGAIVDSPYDAEGHHIATGRANPPTRPATPAELKEARPALLKLFLDCEETAPAESIVAAFLYAGAKPEEAAKAAQKVAAAHAKRAKEEAAKAAKVKADQAAAWARWAAALPLSEFAAQVESARRELATRNWRGAWEKLAEVLLVQAKELFKARKEAKARGWTRLAADLLTREKLLRAGAKDLEAFADRSHARANWGLNREAVQQGAAAMRAGCKGALPLWKKAREGAEALGNAARNGLGGHAYMKARAALAGADLARMAEGLEALEKAFAEREEAAKAEERAAALEKAAASLAAWRDDSGPMPGGRLSDLKGGALIRAARVTRDDSGAITGGRLETSWGAQVPLMEAVKAFRFLKLCRDKGQAWKANGHILEVGHFRVDSVSPEGDFVAGCHKINWGEVSALASRLGLADLAPADTTKERELAHE
jgi:hypothetical protein